MGHHKLCSPRHTIGHNPINISVVLINDDLMMRMDGASVVMLMSRWVGGSLVVMPIVVLVMVVVHIIIVKT